MNSLIIIKLPFYQQEYVQIFPLPSPSITCASLWFRVRQRPEKYLLLSPWRRELYGPGSHFFLFDRHEYIHTANLPVCSSGQHTYVTGLFNFFFDWQNRFLFSENNFSEELVSYWLLTLYVTSFSQCK